MSIVEFKSFARAGLLGNPSDGYHGKAIAVSVRNFAATVSLTDAKRTSIDTSEDESHSFSDLLEMSEHIGRCGYYGGRRLMRATIKRFVDTCVENNVSLSARNFSLRYSTNIPRSVGLAGSSALITATLKCLVRFYEIDFDNDLLASMALSVEKDLLNIPAGLMDRVIQMREGIVFMDFGESAYRNLNGFEAGTYSNIESRWLSERLFLAWADEAAEPTEVLHNRLRERYQSGDPEIVQAMTTFAQFAEDGKKAIEAANHELLSQVINANYDLRKKICQLPKLHQKMVESARQAGGSAKFCGSGGAIVGTFDSPETLKNIEAALSEIGCKVVRPEIFE